MTEKPIDLSARKTTLEEIEMPSENKSNQMEIIKRSLVEIRGLKNRIEELEGGMNAPIAIVGIGCDFPGGVGDPEQYWDLLCSDATGIVDPPEHIWGMTSRGYDYSDRIYRGGYLRRSLAEFDSLAFGIAPMEAKYIDPQHRLFLENTWKALADAGIPLDSLEGSETGVFCGITGSDYLTLMLRDLDTKNYSMYLTTGNCANFAAGRISYILGLKGPSMAIDTACSSSLVAVHLACENIRRGACSLAIAGGVNAILAPNVSESLIQGNMISASARCSPYDRRANGYVRGEGCGVVVLKSLEDALADGDGIYGVIRSSVTKHDGKKSGLTVPNSQSQSEMIATALRAARVEPEEVTYVEGHGTGTSLGDPIELEALKRSFRGKGTAERNPLLVGSVKAKLGHLEAASGIAALIKASLVLTHSAVPAHLEAFEGNENFDWDGVVDVPKSRVPLNEDSTVRIAVNSLGASGTNAHLIMESAPKGHRRLADRKSPSVPFKRSFCWYRSDPRTIKDIRPVSRGSENPYKRYELAEGKYVFPLPIDSVPHIREHRIFGNVVLTGSIYFDLALKIAQEHFPSESIRNYSLHNVNLSNPIIFDENTIGIQAILEKPRRREPWLCRISLLPMNATPEDSASRYASIDVALIDAPSPDASGIEPEKLEGTFEETYSGEEFYSRFWGHTFTIGPKFRLFQKIWRDDGRRLLGYTRLDAFKSETADYGIDTDSFLAYLCSLVFKGVLPKSVLEASTAEGKAVVGTGYDFCHHYGKLSDHDELYCLAVLTKRNDDIRQYNGDCTIYSARGEPLCKMGNISFNVIGDANFRTKHGRAAHPERAESPRRAPEGHALLGHRHEKLVAWTYESPLEYDTYPIIGDHRTFDYSLFPGLGYIHLAAMAVREINPGFVFNRVYDLRITQPILLRKGEECVVRTRVEKLSDHEFDYSILGRSAKSDIVNMEWGFSSGACLAREPDVPTGTARFDPAELESYP